MRNSGRNSFVAVVLLTMVLNALIPASSADCGEKIHKIGVIAVRGHEQALEAWQPTAEYLTSRVRRPFKIVPFDLAEIDGAVQRGEVDFVLTNPAKYAELEEGHGATRIATMKVSSNGRELKAFGGVIFHRADRNDIREISDLKGKSFAAVQEISFAGWQTAWREFKELGIDPHRYFSRVDFIGFPQDRVVDAVLSGKNDAGTVRTGIIEAMAEEGKINIKDLRILNQKEHQDFPLLHSTRLYPEWAFAKLCRTPDELAEQVLIALLDMPRDAPAVRSAKIAGWTIPQNYEPVSELMKELQIGPYRNYGKLTLAMVLRRYWYLFFTAAAIVLLAIFFAAYVQSINRRLSKATNELKQTRDGLEIQVKERTTEILDSNKKLVQEITERKQAETALRESEQRLRVIFDTAQEGIIQVSPTGHIVFANRRMAEMFGCALDEAIGSSFNDHVHHDQKAGSRASMGRLICGEVDVVSVERHLARKDGSDFWGHISARRLEGPDGKITAMVGVVTDITEWKNATEALKRSEEKYRSLFEESKDVIYISTPDGKFIDINTAGVVLFGYSSKEELLSADIARQLYVDPSERTSFKHAVEKQGFVTDYEVRMKKKSGEELAVMTLTSSAVRDEQGNIVAYRGIMRDMTEHRKLEQQLRQSQKMEAIGQLAGGIAHDFNNILSAIVGYGGMMQMKMAPDDANRLNVEQVLSAADRAANLTHSLLAFSRKQIINPKPVNLNDIIRKVERLLSRLIGEDVEIHTQTTDRDLTVWADSLQIEQVLMNLATNARDAMPTGGRLIIKTEAIDLNDEFMMHGGILKHGRYALLTVTDTGGGMDEKTQEKIFEPFFTTKEVGKGTGLGLAMVYGIIKQHNGYILASSRQGKGTTFSIYLPLIDSAESEPASTQKDLPVKWGTETILLVEDNEAVRKMTGKMLSDHGYTVIEAVDGEEAIQQFREHQDRIQLLLLDVVLPKKNGKEVYEEVRRIQPGVKVLFTSGYTADVIHAKGIADEGLYFISKPAGMRELLQKIRDVLDA